ncbi:MAG: 8-oxo-dGTP diphosphatase [Parcubacteria group bacterium]
MENEKIVTTLCLILQNGKILLGMKKRGFGKGRWNGFGGKVLAGETMEEAVKREVREEAGVKVLGLAKIGVIDFHWEDKSEIMEVNIFRSEIFSGEPKETEEMKPQWFGQDELNFQEMWSDDKYWYPLFLGNKKFRGDFLFDKLDNVLKQELKEVEEI